MIEIIAEKESGDKKDKNNERQTNIFLRLYMLCRDMCRL